MQWAQDNWILLLLVGGMLGMHFFGHRGHGARKNHADNAGEAGDVPSVSAGGGCCGGKSHEKSGETGGGCCGGKSKAASKSDDETTKTPTSASAKQAQTPA